MATIVHGPDLVLGCPHCGAKARIATFEVDDFADAVSWTDGYREIKGLQRQPDVGRCHACKKLYWVENATPLGEIASGVDVPIAQATSRDTPIVEPVGEDDYYDALETGLAIDSEHELALRVSAWWRNNDRVRKTKSGGSRFPTDERATKNLERLIELCADGNHETLLFRVEALRELGRFDEAARALSWLCSDYDAARRELERLIAQKSRDIHILFGEDSQISSS